MLTPARLVCETPSRSKSTLRRLAISCSATHPAPKRRNGRTRTSEERRRNGMAQGRRWRERREDAGYAARVSFGSPTPHPPAPLKKLRPDELDRPSPAALHALPRHPLVVVLDRVRSAYNVGSILRTADAARAAHVYVTGYTPTPEHRKVAKTALGAEDTVPWSVEADAAVLLDRLRAEGHTLAALEQTNRPASIGEV